MQVPWQRIREEVLAFCRDGELGAWVLEDLVREHVPPGADQRTVHAIALDVLAELFAEDLLMPVNIGEKVAPWHMSSGDAIEKIRFDWARHQGPLVPGDIFWAIAKNLETSKAAWRVTEGQ